MVLVMPKSWLADLRSRLGATGLDLVPSQTRPGALGILAFEAAAAMSRLVSLHCSVSDAEILRLRSNTMRAEGVAYLTSTDQSFSLRLACGELMADLDRAADAAARLGAHCSSVAFLSNFDRVYTDAKAGSLAQVDLTVGFSKGAAKRFKKMERHVAATAKLYTEMDALNELEASERRMEQWKRHSGPIPVQKPDPAEPLKRQLKSQRQRVRRLMEDSLWSVAFDKAAKLMAKSALAVLARISIAFGQFVPGLPPLSNRTRAYCPRPFRHSSGPLERPITSGAAIRHSAPIFRSKDTAVTDLIKPTPSMVGGSGMALRYANVILSAEMLLAELRSTDDDEQQGIEPARRGELYEMLPVTIRAAVKAKLRECWRSQDGTDVDEELAEGWKEAVERILRWLGPMAHDTVRWHEERNMDRMQRFSMQPRALMVQTLHFADRQKAEAAIVEVLVGISCMCWYDDRHRPANDK